MDRLPEPTVDAAARLRPRQALIEALEGDSRPALPER
jgi:hypothetical protein